MVDLKADTLSALPEEFGKAVKSIRNRVPEVLGQPKVGIVCGSGLSGLGEVLKEKVLVPYDEIEGFSKSTGT